MILITVSSDGNFHREVTGALARYFRFDAAWQLGYHDTDRLKSAVPEEKYVVIVDFTDPAWAWRVARTVDAHPEFASIALGCGADPEELLQLMRVGICDALPQYGLDDIRQATRRAITRLTSPKELLGDVYAFVPAKPGCGATTLATHATAAAARLTTEPVLLLDFDVRLGVTSFLLKAGGNHTIMDALIQSDALDHDLWSSLVTQRGNLHLVGSGPMDFARTVPPERFSEVLRFAVQKYSLVSVDLPGAMEEHECETLMRSKQIFLVCTPDIGALHVARRKSKWLHERGLVDRVAVVLNGVERRNSLAVADIERIIELPVRYLVPSGPSEISRAAREGACLQGNSPLAKQMAQIGSDMVAATPSTKKPSPVKRFIEYFSISAVRDLPAS